MKINTMRLVALALLGGCPSTTERKEFTDCETIPEEGICAAADFCCEGWKVYYDGELTDRGTTTCWFETAGGYFECEKPKNCDQAAEDAAAASCRD
jgi:hypothetical protein